MRQAMESTAKLTAFVVFILVGARIFSLTFYGVDGHKWVEHLLLDLPGGQIGFLIVVNILVFLLAFFLDFFELAFIVVPLLGPVAEKLGIDLIWFGVLLGVNMQTSFMHPPFGFALFYLRSVAPAKEYVDKVTRKTMAPVTTGQIYWGAVPYVVHPGDHGGAGHPVPADGDGLQGRCADRRPDDDRDRGPDDGRRPPATIDAPAGRRARPGRRRRSPATRSRTCSKEQEQDEDDAQRRRSRTQLKAK